MKNPDRYYIADPIEKPSERIEDQPIQKAMFTGNGGSDHDLVLAVRAGLHHGRLYEVRPAGFRHGVEFVDVINIGQFNSVMFEKR